MGNMNFGKGLFGVLNILNPGWDQPGWCVVLARMLVRLVSAHQGRRGASPGGAADHLGTQGAGLWVSVVTKGTEAVLT